MPPTRAPSAASKQTRTARTAAWLKKTGSKTALPYDWTEKEVYLQQLVDVGLLSTAEAQAMAASHAPVAAAPEGDGGAAAAAPAPDLATVKTMLYSQHSTAPVNQTKTEDWRSLGQVVTAAVKRPDPPVLFSLPLCVERG